MEFSERTIRIIIDEKKCRECTTHVCVDACKTFSRGILAFEDGRMATVGTADVLARKGTECLACEYECHFRGNGAITIEVPIQGLDEYKAKHATA